MYCFSAVYDPECAGGTISHESSDSLRVIARRRVKVKRSQVCTIFRRRQLLSQVG